MFGVFRFSRYWARQVRPIAETFPGVDWPIFRLMRASELLQATDGKEIQLASALKTFDIRQRCLLDAEFEYLPTLNSIARALCLLLELRYRRLLAKCAVPANGSVSYICVMSCLPISVASMASRSMQLIQDKLCYTIPRLFSCHPNVAPACLEHRYAQ